MFFITILIHHLLSLSIAMFAATNIVDPKFITPDNVDFSYLIGPATITQPGKYKLANDIVGTITIAANDVFLDLNEKILSTTLFGAHNIDITNQQNVTICNGNLHGVATVNSATSNAGGIFIASCTTINLIDLNIEKSGVTTTGTIAPSISASNSNAIAIIACKINSIRDSRNRVGIFILNITNMVVQNSTFTNLTTGIRSNGSISTCLINQGTMYNTGLGIIFAGSGNNVIIENCFVQQYTSYAFQIANTDPYINVTLRYCEALNTSAALAGFSIVSPGNPNQNIILSNCNVLNAPSAPGASGIEVSNASDLCIENCILQSCQGGITIDTISNATFNNCNLSSGQTGILIGGGAQGINVYDCVVNDCSVSGISVASGSNTNGTICNNLISNSGVGLECSTSSCICFGNTATQNTTNYVGLPAVTIVTFDISAATYTPAPFYQCNFSVVP